MFGKFCLRVFVGIVVFLLFGGKDAVGMLAMAVICTAGVGLIVVIPAAYLIGLICTIWFVPFGSKKKNAKVGPPNSAAIRHGQPAQLVWKISSAERVALKEFIEAARGKGESSDMIRRDLLRMGWDEESVNQVQMFYGIVQEAEM